MAEERKEVVYELRIDQSLALQQFDKLNLALEKNKAERRDLNKEIRANEDAIKKLTVQITLEGDADGKLGAQMTALAAKRKDLNAQQSRAVLVGKDLSSTHREMSNDISGLTARHERFRDKMSQAFGTQARALVGQFVAAFAVQNLLSFGNELSEIAIKSELLDRRARVLFGDSLPQVTEQAEKNANAIGLTKREYIALASAQQDVFTNLGFGKAQTASLATQIVDLSGKLEDWTAGEIDAARASDILKDATMGKTKGLTELGIAVKANKEELAARVEVLMQEQGVTKGQAEALANLELVYASVTTKLDEFSQGQETLDDRMDKANARMKEAKEILAETWGAKWAEVKAGFFDFLTLEVRAQEASKALGREMSTAARVAAGMGIETDEVTKLLADYAGNQSKAVDATGDGSKAINIQAAGVEELGRRLQFLKDAQTAASISGIKAPQNTEDEINVIEARIQRINLDNAATEKQIATLETLRATLKDLREERERVDITDTEDLALKAQVIKDLEAQIAALDGATKKTKDLTKAEQERLDTMREMQALAAQAPTDIAPIGTGSIGTETNAFTGTVTPAFAAPTPAELLQPDETSGIFNQFQDLYDQDQQAFEALQMAKVEAIQGTIEALRGLAGDNAEMAKFLLSLEKIAGIAQVIMGSAQARAHALFNFTAVPAILPPGIPNPAKAIAAGIYAKELALIQVNTATSIAGIAAQTIGELQGLFEGGIVDPSWGPRVNRSNGDNVLVRTVRGPVTLKTGEAVLNDRQQERVKRKTGMHIGELAELPGFKRDFNPRRILPLDVWMPKRSFADGGFLQPSPEVIAQAATVRAIAEVSLRVDLDLVELARAQNKVAIRESARTSS